MHVDLLKLAIVQFFTSVGIRILPEGFFVRHKRFAVVVFMVLLAALVASLFTGCATSNGIAVNPSAIYKHDMKLIVSGKLYDGVGVIPHASYYDLEISSRTDMDLLTISTCGRDETFPAGEGSGWVKAKRTFKYRYVPLAGLEDSGSCIMRLGAYEKDHGQNAWGLFDFASAEAVMPALTKCNGLTQSTAGVSFCETRAGIIQEIDFSMPMKVETSLLDPKCQITSSDGKSWQFQTPTDECVYAFIELEKPHYLHRHTSSGYTDVPIRGE